MVLIGNPFLATFNRRFFDRLGFLKFNAQQATKEYGQSEKSQKP